MAWPMETLYQKDFNHTKGISYYKDSHLSKTMNGTSMSTLYPKDFDDNEEVSSDKDCQLQRSFPELPLGWNHVEVEVYGCLHDP